MSEVGSRMSFTVYVCSRGKLSSRRSYFLEFDEDHPIMWTLYDAFLVASNSRRGRGWDEGEVMRIEEQRKTLYAFEFTIPI